jgi:hypothetical protein
MTYPPQNKRRYDKKKPCLDCGKAIGAAYTRCHSCANKRRVSSTETKLKITLSRIGSKNPNWKGNNLTYQGLHTRVRAQKPKPEFCELCGIKPAYDLANISGEYKYNLSDWQYLCRRCHMIIDNRLIHLIAHSRVGEHNGRSKLTPTQIHEIRALAGIKTQKEIGVLYNITQTTVSLITRRQLWDHI